MLSGHDPAPCREFCDFVLSVLSLQIYRCACNYRVSVMDGHNLSNLFFVFLQADSDGDSGEGGSKPREVMRRAVANLSQLSQSNDFADTSLETLLKLLNEAKLSVL